MGEAWIIDAVRTPRGRGKKDVGALSHIHPQELMAQALQALSARTAFEGRVQRDLKTLVRWAARDNDRTMLYAAELKVQVGR